MCIFLFVQIKKIKNENEHFSSIKKGPIEWCAKAIQAFKFGKKNIKLTSFVSFHIFKSF